MIYASGLKAGFLLKRYKRFLADVELPDGSVITMHCPNTGSMKNCMQPGSRIWYSTSSNPTRKYANTWEFIESDRGGLIGINTGISNTLVKEAINKGLIPSLAGYSQLRTEIKYGEQNSRIDILLDKHVEPERDLPCFIEVKNVSLCEKDAGLFPDAVTQRGQKHLQELLRVVQAGHRAVLFFCVQHSEIRTVSPCDAIDPEYGRLLRAVHSAGVEIVAYRAQMDMEAACVNLVDELLVRL